MATLQRSVILDMVRDGLNEQEETVLLDTEINAIIGDGYKHVAVMGLGAEITYELILTEGAKIYAVPNDSGSPFRPLYVEHDDKGLMCIMPQLVGNNDAAGLTAAIGTPKFWHHWGDLVILEPAPNAAAVSKDTFVHCACYPSAALAGDTSVMSDLPEEFHECVYEYALAYAALKLKRWGDAAVAYNRYIASIQRNRFEYVWKIADPKAARAIPDNVTMDFGKA